MADKEKKTLTSKSDEALPKEINNKKKEKITLRKLTDFIKLIFVFLSVFAFLFELYHFNYGHSFKYVKLAIYITDIFFLLDILVRLFVEDLKKRIFKDFFILDIISILPVILVIPEIFIEYNILPDNYKEIAIFYFPVIYSYIRYLRLARLIHVLRMLKYFKSEKNDVKNAKFISGAILLISLSFSVMFLDYINRQNILQEKVLYFGEVYPLIEEGKINLSYVKGRFEKTKYDESYYDASNTKSQKAESSFRTTAKDQYIVKKQIQIDDKEIHLLIDKREVVENGGKASVPIIIGLIIALGTILFINFGKMQE